MNDSVCTALLHLLVNSFTYFRQGYVQLKAYYIVEFKKKKKLSTDAEKIKMTTETTF